MASLKLFLAIALCLAVSARAQFQTPDPTQFTCPPNWVPFVESVSSTTVVCAPDPCVGACGTGNMCTAGRTGISGRFLQTNTCMCNPPSVLSQIVYKNFCFVPGTDVCNPNPCKNGATCQVVRDYNGQPGAHQCNNANGFAICPPNFYGLNCDIPGPVPTPTPKGLPRGGPNPYTTF